MGCWIINDIYKEIEPVIEDIENTVVLFPEIIDKNFDKLSNTSAINVIARTAYFNNYITSATARSSACIWINTLLRLSE